MTTLRVQTTCRQFAFEAPSVEERALGIVTRMGQDPQGLGAEGIEPGPEGKRQSKRDSHAKDLHKRADLMFAAGYQASAWALRQRAWRLEA
ncbi:hypothetical protein WNB94_00610 [Aquabacterium sp. A3]|uniref:hypothetical protein n=1 Tax=Aquabacterium sp. A3 TaxID=3132829 RepID=UPI00311A3124